VTDTPELDIDIRDRFERDWGIAERICFTLLGLLLLAGLIGLLGDGWLSKREVRVPGTPLEVHYDRFLRDRGDTSLEVELTAPAPADTFQIAFDRDFIDREKVRDSSPKAESAAALDGGVLYTFRLGPDRKGRVVFSIEPQGIGLAHGALSYGGSRLVLHQVVYP
jgi:hypothetical protein